MSIPANLVTIHPYFKVHEGKLEEFRAALPAFIERSATEPDSVFYEFSSNGDVFFCREGYAGADGALSHLANVGDLLQELIKISDLIRLEFHGPAEELEKLREPTAVFNPAMFVCECGVRR